MGKMKNESRKSFFSMLTRPGGRKKSVAVWFDVESFAIFFPSRLLLMTWMCSRTVRRLLALLLHELTGKRSSRCVCTGPRRSLFTRTCRAMLSAMKWSQLFPRTPNPLHVWLSLTKLNSKHKTIVHFMVHYRRVSAVWVDGIKIVSIRVLGSHRWPVVMKAIESVNCNITSDASEHTTEINFCSPLLCVCILLLLLHSFFHTPTLFSGLEFHPHSNLFPLSSLRTSLRSPRGAMTAAKKFFSKSFLAIIIARLNCEAHKI